jgi:hypothetical protein
MGREVVLFVAVSQSDKMSFLICLAFNHLYTFHTVFEGKTYSVGIAKYWVLSNIRW